MNDRRQPAMHRLLRCPRAPWPAFALALLLVACGGGGGSGAGGGNILPSPSAADAANAVLPRIEPYDPANPAAPRALAVAASDGNLAVPVAVAATPVDLGPPPASLAAARAAALAAPAPPAKAQAIGQRRDAAATATTAATARLLAWQPLPGGGQAAAVRLRSPDAVGLRLGLRVDRLPAGAVLRAWGDAGFGPVVGASEVQDTLAAQGGRGLFWMPAVAGPEATLQVELPPGADPAEVALAVPAVAHLWFTHAAVRTAADMAQLRADSSIGTADSCNVDATCSPGYADQARSVARMEYVDSRDSQAYVCVGTLVADVAGTGRPFFLSANHCVGDQASASTISTYWFFQSRTCNSLDLDPRASQLFGGATLHYASNVTDTSFMELRRAPPASVMYAGLLLGPPALGSVMATLHHPSGDLLKLSIGTLASYGTCGAPGQLNCVPQSGTAGNFLALPWSSGTTQLGSSGSPLFATIGSRRYVAGQLYAGRSSCTRPDEADYFGRFDQAYPNLKTWLGNVPGT